MLCHDGNSNAFASLSFCLSVSLCFLGLHPQHIQVLKLGAELEVFRRGFLNAVDKGQAGHAVKERSKGVRKDTGESPLQRSRNKSN